MQQYQDKILGTITLRESNRAQTVSIRMQRNSGQITLVYPIGYDLQKAIDFLEQKRDRIVAMRERNKAKIQSNPPATSYDLTKLRTAALEHLPTRIAQIAEQINMSYNRVSIRATRSRWGSCTSRNDISLSIYLMILPQHLIDFVIIHELCHTIHHNHSPKFHALLNHICGGREKEFNRELRGYSIGA
ncbi:MAG: M48 family metallopeptidase [Rikenellaceae bacterium]